jgi:hypothetical protein
MTADPVAIGMPGISVSSPVVASNVAPCRVFSAPLMET